MSFLSLIAFGLKVSDVGSLVSFQECVLAPSQNYFLHPHLHLLVPPIVLQQLTHSAHVSMSLPFPESQPSRLIMLTFHNWVQSFLSLPRQSCSFKPFCEHLSFSFPSGKSLIGFTNLLQHTVISKGVPCSILLLHRLLLPQTSQAFLRDRIEFQG